MHDDDRKRRGYRSETGPRPPRSGLREKLLLTAALVLAGIVAGLTAGVTASAALR